MAEASTGNSRTAAGRAGERALVQYGWISGPVECCCSRCEWTASFEAVDSSVPAGIQAEFENHNCEDYAVR